MRVIAQNREGIEQLCEESIYGEIIAYAGWSPGHLQ